MTNLHQIPTHQLTDAIVERAVRAAERALAVARKHNAPQRVIDLKQADLDDALAAFQWVGHDPSLELTPAQEEQLIEDWNDLHAEPDCYC